MTETSTLDLILLIQQGWFEGGDPLMLNATLRELGGRSRAEYRAGLEQVLGTIDDGAALERLFQTLIVVGDEAHLGVLTLAVQARRQALANAELDAILRRDYGNYIVIATGELPKRV